MTHTITILGSTGSIGRQTLSVAEELGLRVAALTAEKNVDLLETQCRKYRPELAVMTENAAAEELKTRLADMNIRVLAGSEAIVFLMSAMVSSVKRITSLLLIMLSSALS